jgi:hypothetical protein
MIPDKGQHVKCFMRSTMVLEGIVEDWTDTQVVLKSLDGQSLIIVHRPTDDIILTKVVLQEPKHETPVILEVDSSETKQQIRAKLQDVLQSGDSDTEKMNLQQLRKLLAEQDKQIITQKRVEHFGSFRSPKRALPYSPQTDYIPIKLPRK